LPHTIDVIDVKSASMCYEAGLSMKRGPGIISCFAN